MDMLSLKLSENGLVPAKNGSLLQLRVLSALRSACH
jgi:hypothetical protein